MQLRKAQPSHVQSRSRVGVLVTTCMLALLIASTGTASADDVPQDQAALSSEAAKPAGAGSSMGAAGRDAPSTPRPSSEPGIAVPNAAPYPLAQTSGAAIQPSGTQGKPLGMDVSGWQPTVDWQTAWNNGARFAYVKASEGPWKMNDYFAQQYNGSAGVGMLRGAYHFARPNLSSGTSQAQVFINSGGGWSADGKTLPGVLDLEKNASDSSGGCFGLTPAQLTAWTSDFTRTYKSLTGRDATIYTSYYFWQDCLANTSAFSQTNALWIAAYGAAANDVWLPGKWPKYTVWQYDDAGTFPGDQNVFNGTYAQLLQFAATPGSVPVETAPNPATPPVETIPALSYTYQLTPVGDSNGDGVPDLVARQSNGSLWFYAGSGAGGFQAGRQIGTGWSIYDEIAGIGDSNGDGRADLLARKPDGTLWFYAGDGNGNYQNAKKTGSGWNVFNQILGVGDTNSDGVPDVLSRDANGGLWSYSGDGTGGYRAGRNIGTGWHIYDEVVGVGDFDSDGKADVVARHPNGSLWFYPGDGKSSYGTGRQIGTGWSIYDQILGTGDSNRDGKPDLVARHSNGTMWFYAGDGMHTNGYKGAQGVGTL